MLFLSSKKIFLLLFLIFYPLRLEEDKDKDKDDF
jgi:hypothetical protein